jgi:hypothetical protein
MKTTMKTPRAIRRGFKITGIITLLVTALLLSIGAEALCSDIGATLSASGIAAATGTRDAPVVGKELTTEDSKELSTNLLEDSVSEKITEIYREQMPLFYLLNKFSKSKMNTPHGTFSRVHRFYQVDQRPVQGTVTTGNTPGNTLTADLIVDNVRMWTKDCVVIPRIDNPTAGQLGYEYESGSENQVGILQLIVIDTDKGTNKITVQATNGRRTNPADPTTAYMPAIPTGTKLIRLAALGSETDAQAPAYADLPTDTANYVATFHTQYEVTPDFLKHGKEVNWGETQIKDRNLNDMMLGIEMTLVSGQRSMVTDAKDDDVKYEMGGFLYFNQKEFDYDVDQLTGIGLTGEDLNNLCAYTFANNNGSRTKLMLMGSGFARRAQSITDTEKWSTTMTPKVKYGFEFTGISNLFGTLDAMLYPVLDELGLEECSLIVDLANVSLVEVEGLSVRPLDLKGSGQKNVDASYIRRMLTFELRNPKTHALVKPKYV